MAHAKDGVRAPEWWKHLRKFNKRAYHKKARKSCKGALRGTQIFDRNF
jgi:hypothetical protein